MITANLVEYKTRQDELEINPKERLPGIQIYQLPGKCLHPNDFPLLIPGFVVNTKQKTPLV